MAVELMHEENVQDRQLQTCRSNDGFAQLEAERQEQRKLQEELKDKQSDFKRYEEKLKQATFY